MPQRVGFIGLGIMGRPMSRNLLKAGFEVVCFNRSRPAMEDLAREGALLAENPREVAVRSDVAILMLPDTPDVESVMNASPDGLLEGASEGKIFVIMSTISPAACRHLGERATQRGATVLDAPVSGGEKGAIDGTLSIMAGGDKKAFDECTEIFQAMGKTVVYVGPSGAGQIVKACNQIVVALIYEAVSEALVLASKAGINPRKVVEVLNGGLAANRILELRGLSMIEHAFNPGARVSLHLKDLGIALATGHEHGVPLPVTAIVAQMFESLVQSDRGNLDHSALLTFLEDLARHQVNAGQ